MVMAYAQEAANNENLELSETKHYKGYYYPHSYPYYYPTVYYGKKYGGILKKKLQVYLR